jgi:hypothetical protein
MPNSFEYRIIKSTWGIYIRLTAIALPKDDSSPETQETIEITPDLGLIAKPTNIKVNQTMIDYLTLGLQIVATQISQYAGPKLPLVIHILKIEVDFVDYQPEGLACAMIGWAGQEFGFIPPVIPVYYDKTLRKYIFDFNNI